MMLLGRMFREAEASEITDMFPTPVAAQSLQCRRPGLREQIFWGSTMQDMHEKGENHCSRNGIQGIEDNTNLALHHFSALSFQDRVSAEVKEFAEMVYLVALPVFDSTLQLVNSRSMVFLLDSFVRSDHNRSGCCFTFNEILLFFMAVAAFETQFLCRSQYHTLS